MFGVIAGVDVNFLDERRMQWSGTEFMKFVSRKCEYSPWGCLVRNQVPSTTNAILRKVPKSCTELCYSFYE